MLITYVDSGGTTQILATGTGSDSVGIAAASRDATSLDQTLVINFTVPANVTELTVTISDATDDTFRTDLYVDNISLDVVCFAAGTGILTADGATDVAALRVNDLVQTSEGELKPILWIGHRTVSAEDLSKNEKLYPVRITAGALGNGLPKKDLVVSRQHRIVIASPITKRMFQEDEVLVPAIDLIGLPGIYIDRDIETVTYYHIMFDAHEVIVADGALAESFYLGEQALRTISPAARREIAEIFPDLARPDARPPLAKFVPPAKQRKQLLRRHSKNERPAQQHEAL